MDPQTSASDRSIPNPSSSFSGPPDINLDPEAQRFLVQLQTYDRPTWDQLAAMFRLTFPHIASDFAGTDNELLAQALQRCYHRVADMERFPIARAHCSPSFEDGVVFDQATYDIGVAKRKLGLELEPRDNKTSRALEGTPPCDDAYNLYSNVIVWTRWRRILLDVAMDKFDFSRLQAAAVLAKLLDDAPRCSALVCDGFANYLEQYYEHTDAMGDVSEVELGEAKGAITSAAWRIGVNVVYASMEPPGSPRVLAQMIPDYYEDDDWGSPTSPYTKWEEGDILSEDEESGKEEE